MEGGEVDPPLNLGLDQDPQSNLGLVLQRELELRLENVKDPKPVDLEAEGKERGNRGEEIVIASLHLLLRSLKGEVDPGRGVVLTTRLQTLRSANDHLKLNFDIP